MREEREACPPPLKGEFEGMRAGNGEKKKKGVGFQDQTV